MLYFFISIIKDDLTLCSRTERLRESSFVPSEGRKVSRVMCILDDGTAIFNIHPFYI